MKTGYAITTEAELAVPASLKYLLGVRGNAAFGIELCEISISFDGITASAEPIPVELCYATFATNPPGTASTSVTPQQQYGRVLAHGVTAAKDWTTAPTVITSFRRWEISPYGGLFVYNFADNRRPDSGFSEGFVLRSTAAATVNCFVEMLFEKI